MGMDGRRQRPASITKKPICKILFRIVEVYVKYCFNNYYWYLVIGNENGTSAENIILVNNKRTGRKIFIDWQIFNEV